MQDCRTYKLFASLFALSLALSGCAGGAQPSPEEPRATDTGAVAPVEEPAAEMEAPTEATSTSESKPTAALTTEETGEEEVSPVVEESEGDQIAAIEAESPEEDEGDSEVNGEVRCVDDDEVVVGPEPNVPGVEGDFARPMFGTIDEIQDDDRLFWRRDGLFPNLEGDFFLVVVIGSERDEVARYTDALHVCLDQEFTGEVTERESEEQVPGLEARFDLLEAGPENLIITIEFLGTALPRDLDEYFRVARDIALEVGVEQWIGLLQTSDVRLTPAPELISPEQQDYIINAIIDPVINFHAVHNYEMICTQSATATIRVMQGGSAVEADLLRNYDPVDSGAAYPGALEVTLENGGESTNATYDLEVRGNKNGSRYRVTGTWNYPYLRDAPTGGGTACPNGG